MSEPVSGRKKRRVPWFLGLFVLLSFVVLILLQSSNLWKDFTVRTASDTLILYALSSLNFFAFVVFGFIFLRSVLKLARERRALQLGSRLKTRMLIYFFGISLLPIIAMAGFSYLFMNRAIERWFIQIPENVVRAPLQIQEEAARDRMVQFRETAEMVALLIGDRQPNRSDLEGLLERGNLKYIEISGPSGQVLVSAGEVPGERARSLPPAESPSHIPQFDASAGFGGRSSSLVELNNGHRLLLVSRQVPLDNVSQLADASLREFDRLKEQQAIVRQMGFLTLGVLTFLLIFASSWTAFHISRGLTVPIQALAEGAYEIARGNLSHRVSVVADDELAFLVEAFNEMTGKLEANSAEISERRRYIETVLESLPTGVISFDAAGRVTTINRAAKKILKLEDAHFSGFDIGALLTGENRLVVERLLARAKRIGQATEQTTLRTEGNAASPNGNELPVALTASAIADQSGVVLVIEDLSDLIAAQRASAWQEVARRMAHEIKNPLTPIQLSAERIAKRFVERSSATNGAESADRSTDYDGSERSQKPDTGEGHTAAIVRDGTETIVREVLSLKAMVDEFSRFARLPETKLAPGSIAEVIRNVAVLYVDRLAEIGLKTEVADELPEAMIDQEQLKRVFVNLIDNAIEACSAAEGDHEIKVTARYEAARDLLVAEVADNGKGIEPADLQKLFQPYFSTKGRGTGLGLAIVNRIIAEHRGRIKVVPNQPRGARFIIEIPIAA